MWRRPAGIAPNGVRVDELRHGLGRGGCAVVRITDFIDLAVAAIDRWNVQRGGEVERILSQSLVLGDGLMRRSTGGASRKHLDLADTGRLQNGLREISVIARPGDLLDD